MVGVLLYIGVVFVHRRRACGTALNYARVYGDAIPLTSGENREPEQPVAGVPPRPGQGVPECRMTAVKCPDLCGCWGQSGPITLDCCVTLDKSRMQCCISPISAHCLQ